MAMTAIGNNGLGVPFVPLWGYVGPTAFGSSLADATGEGTQMIGRICLPGGPGTSKVLSAAGGGKIHWYSVSISTFVNVASIFRVGVQDLAASGLGDTTFDVYADLVGGGGGVASGGRNTSTMTSGTKTIAHGDEIAIVFEWNNRAGADTVRPQVSFPENIASPYTAVNTTGSYVKGNDIPFVLIEFDDGTVGFFTDVSMPILETAQSFNSGSTPDEYALIFQVPIAMRVSALMMWIGDLDSGDSGEFILYTDPLGTPAAAVTEQVDEGNCGNPSAVVAAAIIPLTTPYDLVAATTYALAYRPTSVNNRLLSLMSLPIAAARAGLIFGTTMQGGQRTNQSGAFGSLSTTVMPRAGFLASHIDIPSGGGAYAAAYVG